MQNKVNGNITGIRDTVLEQIAGLYELNMGADTFISRELLEMLAVYSSLINREISVYIRRNGAVADVSIGDNATVSMPEMRVVRNEERLCGVRCVHTHPNGNARLSDVDIGTLKHMKLDGMASIGVQEGRPTALYVAFLGEWDEAEGFGALVYGPLSIKRLPQSALMREIFAADERLKVSAHQVAERPERAILIGIEKNNGYDNMGELAELAKTAGAVVVGSSVQKRQGMDNATYIGSGKVDELRLLGSALEADIFVADDELSAIQTRNLEEALGKPVIDRTALILDIFAARAQTREGRLQVELAQLKYRLPRLMGMGQALSRQGAGIGTRGPGEKKLETDRRRIRDRVHELEQDIEEVRRQRAVRRGRREKNAVPLAALVGYTNAGKSTLLNALAGSGVLAEDMLFATLDPVVRQVVLPLGTEALLADTVGFIHKLPHELVSAFRATLEEIAHADIILHVIDSANENYDAQMSVVEDVLLELKAADTPRVNVYNKIDSEGARPGKRGEHVWISAKNGTGLDALRALLEKKLNEKQMRMELVVPYAKYEVMSLIREAGRVLEEEHGEEGARVVVMIEQSALWRIKAVLG